MELCATGDICKYGKGRELPIGRAEITLWVVKILKPLKSQIASKA